MGSHRDGAPRALPSRNDTLDRPNPARIYDYALGGRANFAADRAAFDALATVYPDSALAARANRAFLRRAVTFLAQQGIDQFLDVGSGLPTAGNVHEVARAVNPTARVVYVDNDPVAVRYSRQLLADEKVSGVTAIEADLRDPAAILAHPRTRAARFEPPGRAIAGDGAALHPRRRRSPPRAPGNHGGRASRQLPSHRARDLGGGVGSVRAVRAAVRGDDAPAGLSPARCGGRLLRGLRAH